MGPTDTGAQRLPDGVEGGTWQATLVARSWQTTMLLGVLTLILGLVVAFRPSGSLTVIAVLLGILLIISGIFHLVSVFDSAEPHRVWLGIAGLLFVAAGMVLIRHIHLTLAIVGLVVGIDWVVQGIVALIAGISGGSRTGRGWWITFGVISLIAGIVVVSAPVSSVTALAVLMGIWFIVVGLAEVARAFMLRREPGAMLTGTTAGASGGTLTGA